MAKSVITQKRVLYAATGGTVFAVLLMLIAIGTDYWVTVDIPGGMYRNATKSYVTHHHSGLWRICRTEIDNSSRTHIIKRK